MILEVFSSNHFLVCSCLSLDSCMPPHDKMTLCCILAWSLKYREGFLIIKHKFLTPIMGERVTLDWTTSFGEGKQCDCVTEKWQELYIYIYIYIYKERERGRERNK